MSSNFFSGQISESLYILGVDPLSLLAASGLIVSAISLATSWIQTRVQRIKADLRLHEIQNRQTELRYLMSNLKLKDSEFLETTVGSRVQLEALKAVADSLSPETRKGFDQTLDDLIKKSETQLHILAQQSQDLDDSSDLITLSAFLDDRRSQLNRLSETSNGGSKDD